MSATYRSQYGDLMPGRDNEAPPDLGDDDIPLGFEWQEDDSGEVLENI